MCGIFAYLNHLTPKTRAEVIDLLIKVESFCCQFQNNGSFDAGTKTIGIPWI